MAVLVLRLYYAVPGSGVRCGLVCLGSGFGSAPPLLREVSGCACVCVLVPRGFLHLLAWGAVRGCVLGPGLLPPPATPGWGVGACVCVCVGAPLVPNHSWLGCAVWACVLGLGFGCSPPLLVGLLGCVCVRACAPLAPCPIWGPACGVGVCGCCRGFGLPPNLPFGFFLGGAVACLVVALWCWSLAVPVLGLFFALWLPAIRLGPVLCLVVSVPPSPLVRAAPSCAFFVSFLVSAPAWCVSALSEFCFFRWAAALGLVLPVSAGWSFGASSGGPIFRAVCLGGSAASCRAGRRFRGCGPFSCPPPPCFFLGGSLPVPPSALPGLVHALVGFQCGLPCWCWCLPFASPCPGPMGQVAYVHVGLGDPSCWIRVWLCRLGGCARRLREALG